MLRRLRVLTLACLVPACGGSPVPTTPTPTPPPPTTPAPVVTNFAGQWFGTFTLTACDETGDIAKAQWCEQFRAVAAPTLALEVTQTDRTVSAVLTFGGDRGTITGTIDDANHLLLGGDFATSRQGAVILTTVGGWDTTLRDPTHMAGHFAVNQRVTSFNGNMYAEGTLTTFTR